MLYDQSRPPKSQFSIDDIPDLTGKVVIVTGGNAGVGKETMYALLRKNAKVCRVLVKCFRDIDQESGTLSLQAHRLLSTRKFVPVGQLSAHPRLMHCWADFSPSTRRFRGSLTAQGKLRSHFVFAL